MSNNLNYEIDDKDYNYHDNNDNTDFLNPEGSEYLVNHEVSYVPKETKENEHYNNLTKDNNSKLRDEITHLSSKIGQYIQNLKLNTQSKSNTVNLQNYSTMQKEITFYKDSITKLRSQMDGLFNLSKVESLENEIKAKKEILTKLKDEEQTLIQIQKNHQKVIENLEDKYENKQELSLISSKIQLQREELRVKKEVLKDQTNQIKELNSNIYSIDTKIKSINEKINYSKSQKNKNLEIMNEDEVISLESRNISTEKHINTYENKINSEINSQIKLINQLKNNNNDLNLKLKEKQRLSKINDHKQRTTSANHKNSIKSLPDSKVNLERVNKTPAVVASKNNRNPFKQEGKFGSDSNIPSISIKLKEVSKPKLHKTLDIKTNILPPLNNKTTLRVKKLEYDNNLRLRSNINKENEQRDSLKEESKPSNDEYDDDMFKKEIITKIEMLKSEIKDALDNKHN